MASRKTVFQKGEYYHVYNRSVENLIIFASRENYLFLLQKVKEYKEKFCMAIIAYCLMPNHYHFLLRQDADFSVAQFIQAIFNSYSKAFNKMVKRTGTLFEGTFKSIHVHSPDYLMHLCRYIHRNPVDLKIPLVQKLEHWEFSNYPEWIDIRSGTLVDKKFRNDLFDDAVSYKRFVEEYVPPSDIQEKMLKYLLE